MKKTSITLILCVAFFSAAIACASDAGPRITADEALKRLLDGNQRYLAARMTIEKNSTPEIAKALAAGQHPFAIILTCSDSRVPPEIVFDEGLGEIFVVRVAGNIIDPVVLGSIEYAVEHLGCPLIMVLGHSHCGAVTAAVDAKGPPHGNIGALVKPIIPAVKQARQETKGSDKRMLVEAAVDANIGNSAKSIVANSPLIKELINSGKLKLVKVKYGLDDGSVRLLGD